MVKVKVNRLREGVPLPEYATDGSGCFDLTFQPKEDEHHNIMLSGGSSDTVRTGLAFEVPEGHVMLLFSRSGMGFNQQVRLANCVGVIDSDFRGEVKVRLHRDATDRGDNLYIYSAGDRIAQGMIIPVPHVEFVEEELSSTGRGGDGFGSTGA